MWIKIEDNIKDFTNTMKEEIAGLDTLLCSISRGEHALAISALTAKSLSNLPLSLKASAVLRSVSSRSAENLAQWSESQFQILVTLRGSKIEKLSPFRWHIPLVLISRLGFPRSSILAENLTDARLYKVMAEHYCVLSKGKPRFKVDLISGGGADTPKVLTHQMESELTFVLCITDSDKICPDSPPNATSRNCTREVTNSEWVAFHAMLEEREAENIVPITLLEDVLSQPGHADCLTSFQKMKEHVFTDEEWKYLDLKAGTSFLKCLPALNYWSNAAIKACRSARVDNQCLAETKCKAVAKESCQCHISYGIGEKILEHTVNFIETQSIHKTAQRTKTARNFNRWFSTGKLLCEWGAATERIRT